MTAKPSLRERIRNDEVVYGLIVKMPNQPLVEVAGYTGYDLVLIDTEHGQSDDSVLENHLRSARLAGLETLVRLGRNDPVLILRALDAGASGVILPHISTADQAALAVAASRYPPIGNRGLAVSTIAGHHGTMSLEAHLHTSERGSYVIAQAEDRDAYVNSAQVAAVPGLDAVWIGPSDLSMSMGYPGQPGHPEVASAIDTIAVNVAASGNAALCVIADDAEDAARWVERGARIILFNSTSVLSAALGGTVTNARRAVDEARTSSSIKRAAV
ncbi:5-keto-4-deoxy-D-glucarate aldolase [Frondihabitans sucicola]|uniref:5-keto-4-deoxy-D-glucarate aldolase n=1 Tax=Frondihabitans sucicola TaxID=1268041 RepID=A0ABN6XWF0_9MICO|nr:aldolase/citrate lyase family protein [Frondihabitans sucicola]BDZ49334.1 5-keto-4-deoxy-D-glucarate aldolase [Frondihabitans sucicola]